jgi:hypothetical protein
MEYDGRLFDGWGLDMIGKVQPVIDLLEQARERGTARLKGQRAQVNAVELDQVEAVEEHCTIIPAPAQGLERRNAVLLAAHRLTVDQAGAHFERCHSGPDEREAVRPVVAVAREEPDPRPVAARQHPEPVVLDFMQPVAARRRHAAG